MTDYYRATIEAVKSASEDLQPAVVRMPPVNEDFTPGAVRYTEDLDVPIAPGDQDFGDAIRKGVIVVNNDDTNFVTVTWSDPGGTSNSQQIPAGRFFAIPGTDATDHLVFVADTATVAVTVLEVL